MRISIAPEKPLYMVLNRYYEWVVLCKLKNTEYCFLEQIALDTYNPTCTYQIYLQFICYLFDSNLLRVVNLVKQMASN